MSKVTLLDNKSIINEKFKHIHDRIYLLNMCRPTKEDVGEIVFSETLEAQYSMMRDHLNKNSIQKRFFDKNLKNRELLNAYYSHMYTHNHVAFEDEIFEVFDALDGLFRLDNKSDKFKLKKLLVLEELIDVYHFLLEYTCILKEHFSMQLECLNQNEKGKDFTVTDLENFLTTDLNFGTEYYKDKKYNIFDFLKFEGKHISYDIFSREFSENFYPKLSKLENNQSLFYLLQLNREFLRNCNFKDWKNYPIDFYDATKFTDLINITRKMYFLYMNVFIYYNHYINVISDKFRLDRLDFIDSLQIIYGIYMAKRHENIRRQKNDPRYTGNTEGEIVGLDA